jgi:hypothetical protein
MARGDNAAEPGPGSWAEAEEGVGRSRDPWLGKGLDGGWASVRRRHRKVRRERVDVSHILAPFRSVGPDGEVRGARFEK